MKKETKAALSMGLFLAACMVPSVGMFLVPEEPAAANQILSAAPRLTEEDGSFNFQVLQDTSDYVSDHLAFRQSFITAAAAIDAALFRTSAEEKVIVGQGDWLFYHETLSDYLHTDPMSDRDLYSAARTLSLLDEYVRSKGARLYLTVAPNKVTLYPQYLPLVGTPLEAEDDIDRLRPLLEAQGVSYIDLITPFQEAGEELYYHMDTHWTTKGAGLAHDVLIAAMGKEDQAPFFDGSLHAGEGHKGDLYEMLYPAGTRLEAEEVFDREFTFSYLGDFGSAEDQRIETENPARSGSLLMFRDSFGNSLHSFLADAYGHAVFSRSMPYQMSLLEETGADTVLLEIGQRNLEWLAQRPPIFPALERMNTAAPAGDAAASLTVLEDGQLEGCVRLEGTLSGQIDADSPIYVRLGERLFEACPAGDGEDGYPFVLYVEQDAVSGSAAVLYMNQGALLESAATMEGW